MNYEHELEVVVEKNKATIKDLLPETKYYIAVKAYDDEENESDYSKEVSFMTTKALEALKIDNIKVLNTKEIDLYFNLNLKKDSIVDVNLVNKNNDKLI
jgi:hypothetical protein